MPGPDMPKQPQQDAALSSAALARAESLLRAGKLALAEAAFRELVAQVPELAAAHGGLGRTLRGQGAYDKAFAVFRHAVALEGGRGPLLTDLGLELLRAGLTDEAEAAFAGRLRERPADGPALAAMARLVRVRQGDAAALSYLRQAPACTWPGLQVLTADLLHEAGQSSEAAAICKQVLSKAPAHGPSLWLLGRCLLAMDQPEDAAAAFVAAAKAAPRDTVPALAAVDGLAQAGCARLALALCRVVLATHPDLPGALRRQSELARADTDQVKPLLAEARKLHLAGRTDEAQRACGRALAQDPDNLLALRMMARIERKLGLLPAAERRLRHALSLAPADALVRDDLVATLRAQQQLSEALDLCAGFGDDAQAQQLRVLQVVPILIALDRLDEARAETDRFLGEQPQDAAVRLIAADIAFAARDTKEAAVHLAAILKDDPAHRRALNQTARLLVMLRRPTDAVPIYRRLVADRPDDGAALAQYVRLLRTTGRAAEAQAVLDDWAARAPLDPQLLLATLANLSAHRFLPQALELAQHALQRQPDAPGARRFAVSLAIQLGLPLDGLLRPEIDGHPDDGLLAQAAMEHFDLATARQHALRRIAQGVDPLLLHQMLAVGAVLSGDIEEARRRIKAMRASATETAALHRSGGRLIGEIVYEAELEPPAAVALAALPGPEAAVARAHAALQVVRAFPRLTAPAAVAAVSLHRAGLLQPDERPGNPSQIPAKIYQFWQDREMPSDVAQMSASWAIQNPGFAHEVFDDRRARAYLAEGPDPAVLRAYRRAEHPAKRADLLRLAILWRDGGIYADADDRCLKPIAPLLAEPARLVLALEHLGTTGNNFMAAAPGHPVIGAALAEAVEAIEGGAMESLWLSTGPGLLTRAAMRWLAEAAPEAFQSRCAEFNLLPASLLRRYVGICCAANYKSTDRHWSFAQENANSETLAILSKVLDPQQEASAVS